MNRLSEHKPLEIKCDDAASKADVGEFVTAVLIGKPAQLKGNLLQEAVKIVEDKCEVNRCFIAFSLSISLLKYWILVVSTLIARILLGPFLGRKSHSFGTWSLPT
jgi:hypothetical protein